MRRALVAVLLVACAPRAAAPMPLAIETTRGPIHCGLDAPRAPRAVAMIEALAGAHYYDGLAFFRAIPGVLVQTGSPAGDGSQPREHRVPLELSAADAGRLARPGALLLARYTPPPGRADPNPPRDPIGAELVVGLVDMSHLAGAVTVLGTCRDLDVVARIAGDVAAHRPVRVVRATASPPRLR